MLLLKFATISLLRKHHEFETDVLFSYRYVKFLIDMVSLY